MTDKRKIEVLKIIQDDRDNKRTSDYESLEKQGFDRGFLRAMVEEGLLGQFGTNLHLSGGGDNILTQYLMIENFQKSKEKKGIMFDSNIFDDIVNGNLKLEDLEKVKDKGYEFYITHIQIDEINDCLDVEKRKKLDLFKTKIRPVVTETESFVLGLSRLGFARLGDGKILEKLRNNDKNMKKTKDALIGETAIKKDYILLTNDKKLNQKVKAEGGKAMDLKEFKKMLKETKD